MKPGRRPSLTPSQQLVLLRANKAFSGSGEVRRERLVWTFEVAPTPISRLYQLRIEYTRGSVPRVYVVAPNLVELAEGRSLPHVYGPDEQQRLCLYHPRSGQWNANSALGSTVLPWAVLWLFYFEDWLRTGVWSGGGEHPDGSKDDYDEAPE